ncbi:hypothetical protein BZL35_00137 [Candidatus Pandoraea novymonadis]|uniref:Uncharacterized protein n=1 Tax=Candidatus Pandoraea novymonadis TaxID=1808959 RepID=A0ABX5FEN3_9BURK|nr:hypothetical protein BZL35_00137 [Candidatus Pandoraea novymonadis]
MDGSPSHGVSGQSGQIGNEAAIAVSVSAEGRARPLLRVGRRIISFFRQPYQCIPQFLCATYSLYVSEILFGLIVATYISVKSGNECVLSPQMYI